MTEAKPQNYWISPTALHITLNALSDADYMQASVSSGAMIMCYMKGVEGLEYDHGHNYKRWPLRISRTYFTTVTKKYVYVRIPRPTADPAEVVTDVAQVVFASEYIDLYGMTEDGRQAGDASFYYIYTQGIISASEPTADGLRRHWEQDIATGTLASDEAYDDDGDGTWWRWNAVTDTVEFLKTISHAVFEELEAAVATIRNLKVTGIFEAVKGCIDDLRSNNFASGLLDGRGWRITTDNVGDGSGGSEMEIDFLKVRKKATFMELEVRKETFVGGNQNYSPAGSIIYRVDYMDEDGNAINWTELNVPFLLKNIAFLGDIYNYAARRMVIHKMQDGEWAQVHHFRCYLLADDGTTATRNWWRAGDQVRSQTFNRALSSKDKQSHTYDAGGQPVEDPATPMPEKNPNPSKPVETSYYWRLCSNTGSEKLEDGKVYDYIDLPFEGWYGYTSADIRSFCDAGSGIPVAGDHIVCMGNRNDQERMNMISLCTTGTDNNPPSIKGYRGIHTFNIMPANKVFEISPDDILFRSNRFRFLIDDGNILPPVIDRGEWGYYQRYHYYDRVSWNGSMWLCLAVDEYVWQDAAGTGYADYDVTDVVVGEGEFTYTFDGEPRGNDHYYKTGKVGGKTVYYIRFYTYLEPVDGSDIWMKQVAKGTEITDSDIMYAASLDGVNHPDDEDAGGIDPSTVVVPDAMKSQTTALLSSFAQALAPTAVPVAGSATHEYLSKLYYEARSQYCDAASPYGLPLLYRKELFPSLTEYYGTESNTDGAFSALAGVLFAMVLCEIRPDRHNAVWKAGYNLGGDKSLFVYRYNFASDRNIARMVGSVLWAAMRGIIQPDTKTMQRELGGSDLGITIREVSDRPFAEYKDSYYIDLPQFMPSAPGPYLTGYADRSSIGGVPYDANDLADHNLQQDLDIYNLVVSEYNLGGPHHQEVVQAIADKEMAMAHLFGRNRSQDGYSFHPVFGTDTIGKEISDSGPTASLVSDIASIGRGLRHPLQLGAYYGRRRPGQSEADGVSKSGAAGVLMNMTIDNIDGSPSGYGREGDYNTHEASSVYANSYPSGHSSSIWAVALMLIEAMPRKAALIMKEANIYAMNRQITRYHWNSDTIHGRVAGATIAPMMRASSDWPTLFAAAKAELVPGGAGAWKDTIEATGIKMGWYLWTRRKTYYSDNREPTVEYSVARWGIDGDGIAEIDSVYLATSNTALVITASSDSYPMPGDAGWPSAGPQAKWFDTFAAAAQANGGVGQMQGWNVWQKTVVKYDAYDKTTGDKVEKPDMVDYQCSRIGKDGQIGMEEYYLLSKYSSFDQAFGGTTYDKAGIRWYKPSAPESEKWRLSDTLPNICTKASEQQSAATPIWSTKMPAYDKATHGDRIYLWNFEQSVDGDGTEYATRPVCIGNHAKGIRGVIELYALSASQTPVSADRPIPADINAKNTWGKIPTGGFSDPQVWADEKYERAPSEDLPYQWNWTRTLYSSVDPETGVDYEDHYHVSSVKGTRGEDGTGTEYIYCRPQSHKADGTPLSVTVPDPNVKKDAGGTARSADYIKKTDDFVPYQWTDNPAGIDFQHQIEYQAERKSSAVSGTGGFTGGHEWGLFSQPAPWSKWGSNGRDGDGVEYVFIRTANSTAPSITNSSDTYAGKTYLDDDYLPLSSAGRCTDDPQGTSHDYPFEWVAKRTKGSPNAETGVRQWEKYSGTMALWATFSENVVRCDLDNENDSMLYSSAKGLISGSVVTTGYLYDGQTDVSSKATWSIKSSAGCTATISGRTVTVTAMSAATGSVVVQAVYNSQTYTATLTLKKIVDGDKYDLVITPNAIAYNESTDSPATTAITVEVWRMSADGTRTKAAPPSGYATYLLDGSTQLTYSAASSFTYTSDNSARGSITVKIAKGYASTDYLDCETVPVNKAKDGQSSFTSHVFKRQNSQPSAPSGGSYSSPVPSGWSDGVPDGTAMVWMSTRIFSSDGKVPQQSAWTTPRQMTDTADFDVEFSSVANPNPPSGHPNTNTQWGNTSSSSTIWMATSECRNGVWSDWQVAKIKGEKGDKGESITKKSETYRYATNSTGTRPAASSSDWKTTKPTLQKGYWLFTETTITWSDNSPTVLYTDERNPNDGVAGQDIIVDGSTEMKYYVGTSSTTHPAETSSDWKDLSQVTQTPGKWLWSKATTWYRKASSAAGSRDAGHSVNYNVGYIAKDGEAADEGRGITGITEYYKATNSSAEMPVPTSDSGWSTDPNLSDLSTKWGQNAKYLWNFEKVTYSKAPTVERTKPQILAIWTQDGAAGRGIDSITNYYKVTNSATAPKRTHEGGSGWDDNPVAPSSSNPYLWNYEMISWVNGTPATTYTEVQLIGHFGKDGSQGPQGPQGPQGSYKEIQYARGDSFSDHSDSHIDGGSSGWKSTPPMPSVYYPIVWQRERTVNPSTGSQDSWSYFPMTGQKGDPGSSGRTGLWYRYMGVWGTDCGPGTSTPVKNTDTVGYYVKYGSNFYLNTLEPGVTNTNTPGGTGWELMNSVFQYFISKAIFADTAYLGSFIINGDWLISQHGTVYDAVGGTHIINETSSWNTGGPPGVISKNNAYTYFSSSYPNSNRPSYINFCPVFAVDGKTGSAYLNDLHATGELRVVNSSGTGIVRINNGSAAATTSETNVTILDATGIYSRGSGDGFRLSHNSSGVEFQRYHQASGSWQPFFAGRAVRVESRSKGATAKSLYATDDFVLFSSSNGWWELPTGVQNGKILSLRNINGGTNTIKPASGQRIRDFDGWHLPTDTGRNLNNDERAELVFYNNDWYLNVIGT